MFVASRINSLPELFESEGPSMRHTGVIMLNVSVVSLICSNSAPLQLSSQSSSRSPEIQNFCQDGIPVSNNASNRIESSPSTRTTQMHGHQISPTSPEERKFTSLSSFETVAVEPWMATPPTPQPAAVHFGQPVSPSSSSSRHALLPPWSPLNQLRALNRACPSPVIRDP